MVCTTLHPAITAQAEHINPASTFQQLIARGISDNTSEHHDETITSDPLIEAKLHYYISSVVKS